MYATKHHRYVLLNLYAIQNADSTTVRTDHLELA